MATPTLSPSDIDAIADAVISRLAAATVRTFSSLAPATRNDGAQAVQQAAESVATADTDIEAKLAGIPKMGIRALKAALIEAGYDEKQVRGMRGEDREELERAYRAELREQAGLPEEDEESEVGDDEEAGGVQTTTTDSDLDHVPAEPEAEQDGYATRADYADASVAELRKVAKEVGYTATETKGLDKDGLLDLLFPDSVNGEAAAEDEIEADIELPEGIYTRAQLNDMSLREVKEIAVNEYGMEIPRGTKQDEIVSMVVDAMNAWLADEGFDFEIE